MTGKQLQFHAEPKIRLCKVKELSVETSRLYSMEEQAPSSPPISCASISGEGTTTDLRLLIASLHEAQLL